MSIKNKTISSVIHGHLEAFYETGTEGVVWSLYEDGKEGYEGLHFLEDGDKLKIYNKSEIDDSNDSEKLVIFEGVVDIEYGVNFRPYPWVLKPHKKRICACYDDLDEVKIDPETKCPGHSEAWARAHDLGQAVSNGMWVHGIQRGYDADAWGKMFLDELRAELMKAVK